MLEVLNRCGSEVNKRSATCYIIIAGMILNEGHFQIMFSKKKGEIKMLKTSEVLEMCLFRYRIKHLREMPFLQCKCPYQVIFSLVGVKNHKN